MNLASVKKQISSTPAFILDEEEILSALTLIKNLQQQADFKLLFSIKSLPLLHVLNLALPNVDGFAVSSLFEARLADEALATQDKELHLTTPGLKESELAELDKLCTHISFNSASQYQRFQSSFSHASTGLRLNPKLSFLSDNRFNPCRQYSKLGVSIEDYCRAKSTFTIDGLHFHTLFGATDFAPLKQTLGKIQTRVGTEFKQLKWLNLGGGYLFNQIKDHSTFIELVKSLNQQQSSQVYIEPGKAIVGEAGYLLTTVIDCFQSDGKNIAVLDTSINHNPRVFEYQSKPLLVEESSKGNYTATLVGSTCLAGDIFGEYRFNKALALGDKLMFKSVGAYTLIKANRFNGHNLPDIYAVNQGGVKLIKQYTYQDYAQQWQSASAK